MEQNNQKIILKGLTEFLKEDPSLKEKVSYEELTPAEKKVDDTPLDEAYETYQKIVVPNH